MANEKTTENVSNQRADQWIAGGLTTILVSAPLTISWRVYTAGKIPFWSAWPGILGVTLVGVGVIMISIGVKIGDGLGRVDGSGDSNSSDQRQTAATGDSEQTLHDP